MAFVRYGGCLYSGVALDGSVCVYQDLPICSPWTFRENHSPNIIYTVNRRNQPTAMDLYFLDWVRTRYKTEPETHTKSAHTVLGPSGHQLSIGTTRSAGVGVWVSVSDTGRVGSGWPRGKKKTIYEVKMMFGLWFSLKVHGL